MKVAIVGSRNFNNYKTFIEFMNTTITENNIDIDLIISGGARGADSFGYNYAVSKGIPTKIYKPEWDKYGKAAGFIRNKYIIDDCDICIAFWDGVSHGTKHDIDLCKQQNKKCYICYY